MSDEEQRILQAIRLAIAGDQKSAACELWPSYSVEAASSRLSRVLAGELAIPPALLALALRGPGGRALLVELAAIARRDPDELRERAVAAIEACERNTAEALRMLRDADTIDALDRDRVHRVRRDREKGRRRA